MLNEHYTLMTIMDILAEAIKEPRLGLTKKSKQRFKIQAYRKWAAEELLREMILSNEPPLTVAQEWTSKVAKYATYGQKDIFESALEVGMTVLDILVAMS